MRRFLIAVILLPLLAACSGDPAKVKVSEKVHDKKAYALGEQHAREAIAISGDEAALQDKLLDVRARISNISSEEYPRERVRVVADAVGEACLVIVCALGAEL